MLWPLKRYSICIDMKDTNGLRTVKKKKVGLYQTCMLQFHLYKYLFIYAYKHEGFF